MSIEYYAYTKGPTVYVESKQELIDILDILHTQCVDSLPEDDIATRILENAMEELYK
jgi:hypothetical protein